MAAIAAAAIGAAGALGGGAMSKKGSGNASKAQSWAAEMSAMMQQNQFLQTQANLQPYIANGQWANMMLHSLLGGGGGPTLSGYGLPDTFAYTMPQQYANVLRNPTFAPTQAQLEATPGYQWNLSQGLQGVANSNAAQGRGISGAALKGAASYATGLAQNTLQQQANIFNQNYQNALAGNSQEQGIFQSNLANILGPLASLSGLGESAAAGQGQIGATTGANIGNALIQGGNAQAAGAIGAANAGAGALTGAANSAANYLMFNSLFNNGGNYNGPSANSLLAGAGSPDYLQGALGLAGNQYVP